MFVLQVVEKTDLLGRDFIWEICLNIPDETIADSAIQLLLGISYTNLNSKLKKVHAGETIIELRHEEANNLGF